MRRTAQQTLVHALHVDLYTRALGQRRAARATGVSNGQISHLRRRLYDGPPPRLPNPGNSGHGKLNLEIARVIRARRKAGETTVALGAAFKVRPQTIGKIAAEKLYPEPLA